MRIPLIMSVLVLGVFSCGGFSNTDSKSEQQDRIVVISKQYSEIIYALSAQDDVVAVDLSSTYPPEIKKLPTIGYHRALSAEAVLASKPTLIIHDNNIGPEHVVKQLEELEIPMKVFKTKTSDIAATKALIREMGKYFHKNDRAEELCKKLDADMARALAQTDSTSNKPKVLIIHFGRASNVYLVVTKNSTASQMIEWAGGEMAVTGERGMRHLSAEVVAESDPDIILLTDFGYDRLGSKDKISELPGVSATKAARNGQVYRVEEHDLIYLGPRTGENVIMLQEIIQGDVAQ